MGLHSTAVLDYLDNLKWDGKPRLNSWLAQYMGAEDNARTSIVGAKFLISAIARIYAPGCTVRFMVIFEGSPETRKSLAIRELLPTPEWFTDELSDKTNKDAAVQLQGVWIVEVSEMDAMRLSEAEAIKGFISRSADRYRPAYAHDAIIVPRQCVFIGTTNSEEWTGYLKDQTGNRRFWPIECGKCDVESIIADRDQLWAEARERYFDGEEWFMA